MTDEHQLIDRAQRGDMAAFRELVERSKIGTYRMAYDLTGNRHDAEDLSQEVYIRAYRSLPGFRGGSKWSTWLYRIMMNAFTDKWRRDSKMKVDSHETLDRIDSAIERMHPHRSQEPHEAAEAGVIQEHIDRALRSLSPRERAVFVLRHYHDLKLREIAEVLQIADGSVKTYLFRAIRQLQKELSFYRPDLGLEE